MNDEAEPPKPDADQSAARELRCERCGAYGAVNYGEKTLCAECRAEAGSCCSGEFP